jgi:uncharacterized repeat protein (TIGR02543 family)
MWLKNEMNAFTITWMDGDGNELYTEELEVQTAVSYDENKGGKVSKTGYVFLGWNTDPNATEAMETLPAVSNDAVYYAIFKEAEVVYYEITWQDADGTNLGTEEYAEGETPAYKGELTAPSECHVLSWSPEIAPVSGDMTYTAVWTVSHTAGEPVVENEVEADCENGGSYDTVIYCSECGEELSREPHTTNANGHGTVAGYDYEEIGDGGFGYDPLFFPVEYNGEKTMAQLTADEKDAISHRGKAVREIAGQIGENN